MFDSILVPLDGSLLAECVIPHVVAVGKAFNSKIILLHVLDKKTAGASPQLFDLVNWQINKTEARLHLEKIDSRIRKAGLRSESIVLEGLAAEGIADFSLSHGTKLIVLSSHGQSGLSQWGISSVTQKIILSATSSILVVRAHQPPMEELMKSPYPQILVPLDGSWRAEHVLPVITLMARFHRSQIHLVHVVKTPEMARHMPPTEEDIELSNRIVARNREEGMRLLDQLRLSSSQGGIDIQTHILAGDNVSTALHAIVEQEHIDLVALSAHGYSGANQWPYGSVVINFILFSKAPVLIVQDLPTKEAAIPVDLKTRKTTEK
jgi:nucleotide-binding universal stress UspA family protein